MPGVQDLFRRSYEAMRRHLDMGGPLPQPPQDLYDTAVSQAVSTQQRALSHAAQQVHTYNQGMGIGVQHVIPCVANAEWREAMLTARCHAVDLSKLVIGTMWEDDWPDVVVVVTPKNGIDPVTLKDPAASFPSDSLIATITLMAATR